MGEGRIFWFRGQVFKSLPVKLKLDRRLIKGVSWMKKTDKRKQSLYFPEEMLREIQSEANRQDRSLSWIVQQAWRVSREEIKKFPSVNDMIGEETVGA